MVFCAVQHVGSMDKVVARAFPTDLYLGVAQNQLRSVDETHARLHLSATASFRRSVRDSNSSLCLTLRRRLWVWSPSCVWSGTWESWCGSPGWTAAASALRWQTEQAAEEPVTHPPTRGSDCGETWGGRGSSKPKDKHTVLRIKTSL